jgi:hypothetical protein
LLSSNQRLLAKKGTDKRPGVCRPMRSGKERWPALGRPSSHVESGAPDAT